MRVDKLKYEKGNIALGLGNKYKFGIEIEVFNVNTSLNIKNFILNKSEKFFKGIFTGSLKERKSLWLALLKK